MSRIFTVAQSEFTTLVRTKAFIIGLLLMPVITAGAIGFQVYAQRHSDREDHALGARRVRRRLQRQERRRRRAHGSALHRAHARSRRDDG